MILTCLSPGQSARTFLCASRNSWSRPGFTRKRTALNAVISALLPCIVWLISILRIENEDRRCDQHETDAERCAQALSPGDVLLDRHDGDHLEKPADVAGADDKHQHHDRPAAAD